MKWNKILFLIILAFLMIKCESPIKKQSNTSQININIDFSESAIVEDALAKVNDIRVITVTVEGDDMDRIVEDFNVSGTRVVCDVEVPKGNARLFRIQGKDANGVIQFSGQKIVDIQNSEESILMNDLTIFAPPSVDFVFNNITETEFDVQWVKSTAPDFSHYRVLISTNPVLNMDNNQIGDDIFDINQVLMNISGATPETDYYVAVVVFDTEGYFIGSLTFGDDNSIVKRVHTLAPLTLPDPVEVNITEILSDSFVLRWSRSTAGNFGFYRVLLSRNQALDANNNKIGNDLPDIDRSFMIIGELEPNTVYYTAVITASTNMDFFGSLVFGTENSIVHRVTTGDVLLLGPDDDTFEQTVYSAAAGARFINMFQKPAIDTYVREVWFYLNDTSGEDNNYRVVIVDANGNDIFYSNPLPTKDVGWVGWSIPWDEFAFGYMSGNFGVGLEMTKDNGWPEVGLDNSSDQNVGYYVDTDGSWYTMNDVGLPGNLGINVIVDVAGTYGANSNAQTTRVLTPLNNENIKISTELPGTASNKIISIDKRSSYPVKKGIVRTTK